MSKPTTKQLCFEWLKALQRKSRRNQQVYIRNSMIPELKEWAKSEHGIIHNAATYERVLRSIREEHPDRFIDVSAHFDSKEKVWMLKKSNRKHTKPTMAKPSKHTSDVQGLKIDKEKKQFKAETSRDMKHIILRFVSGDLEQNHEWLMDPDGWFTINKEIFLRRYVEPKSAEIFLQIAVDKAGFQNEYLLRHSLNLLQKYLADHVGRAADYDWNHADGTDLEIRGKGSSSKLMYLHIPE